MVLGRSNSALDAMGTELLSVSGCEPVQAHVADTVLPAKRMRLIERYDERAIRADRDVVAFRTGDNKFTFLRLRLPFCTRIFTLVPFHRSAQ